VAKNPAMRFRWTLNAQEYCDSVDGRATLSSPAS